MIIKFGELIFDCKFSGNSWRWESNIWENRKCVMEKASRSLAGLS